MNQQLTFSPEGEVIETGVVVRSSIVTPAASPQEALDAWHKYEELKRAILREEDFLPLQGKQFPKKSAWRKIATFFNLTVEIVSEKEIKNSEDGSVDFDVVYRAVAPNGRSAVGDGACNSQEKKDRHGNPVQNSRHNTRSTAHTRAYNRAVSNLVGGGEVSAEEIEQEEFRANVVPQTSPKGGSGTPEKKAAPTPGGNREAKGGDPISEGQVRRLWAISKQHGFQVEEVNSLISNWGYAKAADIGWKDYKDIVDAIEHPQKAPSFNLPPESPAVPPIGDDDIPF